MTFKHQNTNSSKSPNLGRHQSNCRVCAHPQRAEIEHDFISWKSPAKIASDYKLRDRASIYRHAHAFNLFPKRSRNVRAALERIIEQVDGIQANAATIVQAITAYAKINSQGQLVERNNQIDLNDLFDRMTPDELSSYAKDGTLPAWFTGTMGATEQEGSGGNDDE